MYQTNEYFARPTRESQIPWLGAAVGFLIGIALVMFDFMAYRTRGYIANPILKILVIIISSMIFYFIGHWYGLVFKLIGNNNVVILSLTGAVFKRTANRAIVKKTDMICVIKKYRDLIMYILNCLFRN